MSKLHEGSDERKCEGCGGVESWVMYIREREEAVGHLAGRLRERIVCDDCAAILLALGINGRRTR